MDLYSMIWWPRNKILPEQVQDKCQNGVHDCARVLELDKADQRSGEHLRLIHVLHQMLQVVNHWSQAILGKRNVTSMMWWYVMCLLQKVSILRSVFECLRKHGREPWQPGSCGSARWAHPTKSLPILVLRVRCVRQHRPEASKRCQNSPGNYDDHKFMENVKICKNHMSPGLLFFQWDESGKRFEYV